MHRLPFRMTALALLALATSPGARANLALPPLPIDSTSVVSIDAMSFSGAVGLPIGVGFAVVPSGISLVESATKQSLVTTQLTGSLAMVVDDMVNLNPVSAGLDLTVTSTFTLYYEGSLTATSGTFAAGISDPISFAPAAPFEFTWSASANATIDYGINPPATTESLAGQSGAFVAGSNVVTIPLGVDLGGANGTDPETLTLQFDAVGVDPLLLNGISLGGFSLSSDGTFTYDESSLDLDGLVNDVNLLNPVISFPGGTLVLSGSVNPDIGPVELTGTFETSPVPVPAAGWLLGLALLGLAGVGRRRRRTGTAASA